MRNLKLCHIFILSQFLCFGKVCGFFGNGFISSERRKKRIRRNFDIAKDILKVGQGNSSISNSSNISTSLSPFNATVSTIQSISSNITEENNSTIFESSIIPPSLTSELSRNQSISGNSISQNETYSTIGQNHTLSSENSTIPEEVLIAYVNHSNSTVSQSISNSSHGPILAPSMQSPSASIIHNMNNTFDSTTPHNSNLNNSLSLAASSFPSTKPSPMPSILSPAPTQATNFIEETHPNGKERPHHTFPSETKNIERNQSSIVTSSPTIVSGHSPTATNLSPTSVPSSNILPVSTPASSNETSESNPPSLTTESSRSTDNADDVKNMTLSQTKTLITSYEGEDITNGVMFDVETWNNEIQVTGLDIHTSVTSEIAYEIYTKEGTHKDFEQLSDMWHIISSGTIQGKGEFLNTPVPQEWFQDVTILPNSVQSFYVTLLTPDLRYTSGNQNADEYINSDLSIQEGIVVGEYPFGIDIMESCIWNGAIHYTSTISSDNNQTNPLTNVPTMSPSSFSYILEPPSMPKRTKSTFLFGLFLLYPSSSTFFPIVKDSIDTSLHSMLRKPYNDAINRESIEFLDTNNVAIINVDAVPVDIEDNDVRCPSSIDSNEKCGATNIYIETSYFDATPNKEVRKVLANALPSILPEIEYKTTIVEAILQSNIVMISLLNVDHNAIFEGEDIALFEDVILKTLEETFSSGLLPFEVTDVEVFGDSISPMSDTMHIRSKSIEDEVYAFTLATSIRTRHFVLHQSLSINEVLIQSIEADSQDIIGRLQELSQHFSPISLLKASSSLQASATDIPEENGQNAKRDIRLFIIIAGSSVGGLVMFIFILFMFSKDASNESWQKVNNDDEEADHDDEFISTDENSEDSSRDPDLETSSERKNAIEERTHIAAEDLLLEPIVETSERSRRDLDIFLLEPHINIDDVTDERRKNDGNNSSMTEILKEKTERIPNTPIINNKKKTAAEIEVEHDLISIADSYVSSGSFDSVTYEFDEDLPSIT